MRGGNQWGTKNHQWRGDNVSYRSLHRWVHRNSPKPKQCPNCELEKKLEAANISGRYLRDLSDWEWLCRRCHMIKDGRLERIHSKEVEAKIAEIQRRPENRLKRSLLMKNKSRNEQGQFVNNL